MREETKRMLAALFGSGAVTFLALAILIPSMSEFGLMLGTLVGAIVGYFGVEWKQTVQGVHTASRVVLTYLRTHSGPTARRVFVTTLGTLRGKYPVFVVSVIGAWIIMMFGTRVVLKCLEPWLVLSSPPQR